jgi:hypothetical protein
VLVFCRGGVRSTCVPAYCDPLEGDDDE